MNKTNNDLILSKDVRVVPRIPPIDKLAIEGFSGHHHPSVAGSQIFFAEFIVRSRCSIKLLFFPFFPFSCFSGFLGLIVIFSPFGVWEGVQYAANL